MTRTRHDLFAKQHLEALLETFGTVTSSRKVTSETREVDIWFVPNPAAQSTRRHLGILGQMVNHPCIIEPFRNAVRPLEVNSCLGKLIDVTAELRRQAKREFSSAAKPDLPCLWILSPTVSEPTIDGFRAESAPDWPVGFYFLAPHLRTALVALHQLPATEATLWLRLLGRNGVQRQAISELLALPSNHLMRQQTIEHLAVLQISLQVGENLDEDERILAMNLTPVYEQWRQETLQEGRQEGRQEGIQVGLRQGERALVLRLLTHQLGALPAEVISQIEVLSLPELEMLGEALLGFSRLEELKDWLR
ncbi:MAG: DUF4351 domain-containing protein [Thermosynechococcaceae cyanobacterium]